MSTFWKLLSLITKTRVAFPGIPSSSFPASPNPYFGSMTT